MTMTLYYSPGACSLAVHIILCEKKLNFDLKKVNLATHLTEDGIALATVNPKNYVPVLVLSDGQIRTENIAILSYLENADYKTIELLSFISTEIHKSFWPFFNKNAPEEYKLIAKDKLNTRFNYIESILAQSEYLNGAEFSAPDAYLFTMLRWLKYVKTGLDIESWSHINSYYKKLSQRPSILAAVEVENISV